MRNTHFWHCNSKHFHQNFHVFLAAWDLEIKYSCVQKIEGGGKLRCLFLFIFFQYACSNVLHPPPRHPFLSKEEVADGKEGDTDVKDAINNATADNRDDDGTNNAVMPPKAKSPMAPQKPATKKTMGKSKANEMPPPLPNLPQSPTSPLRRPTLSRLPSTPMAHRTMPTCQSV